MKTIKVFQLVTILLGFVVVDVLLDGQTTYAQTYYVLNSASGDGAGTDWTNAFKELPSSLERGAIYYIGSGDYGSYTFNANESGTRLITIKKATHLEHGTNVGWQSSFGDGQAVFPSWVVNTSYWVFEGGVGSGEQARSYGFRITPKACAQANIGITIQARRSVEAMKEISIAHVAVTLCGSEYDYRQIGIDAKTSITNDGAIAGGIRIANSYFVGGNVGIRIINVKDSIIEDNILGPNWSSAKNHGGQIVANGAGGATENITIRNNIFVDSKVYVIDFHRNSNANWKIYNNIVLGGTVVGIYATGDSRHPDVIKNLQVYSNTHKNISCHGFLGIVYPGTLTNPSMDKSFAYNNLQYNTKNCTFPATQVNETVFHDYNSYFDHARTLEGGDAPSEPHGQIASGNPFQSEAYDSRLKSPTDRGLTLPPPFDRDFHGRKRGYRFSWGRGATGLQEDAPTLARPELKVF